LLQVVFPSELGLQQFLKQNSWLPPMTTSVVAKLRDLLNNGFIQQEEFERRLKELEESQPISQGT
jgi:hypothetical protein